MSERSNCWRACGYLQVVDTGHDAYVLHPSLMDSALQAYIGLTGRLVSQIPEQTRSASFALETLRIVSRLVRGEMVAWVRYAGGSQAGDEVVKLDVDLCDERGNVCVQMHGFSSRVLRQEMSATAE